MTSAHYTQILKTLAGAKVLVVGDLMLDVYWQGEVSRISPEAPVPVVNLRKRSARLGGAGNVAANIAALGGRAHLIACLGEDAEGRECAALLEHDRLSADLIWCATQPTLVKTRVIAQSQQMIRLDLEPANLPSPACLQQLEAKVLAVCEQYSHIVISDYNKGVVSQGLLRQLIQRGRKVVIDPKPQHGAWYQDAFMLTPNALETGILAADRPDLDILQAAAYLRDKLNLDYMLATLGADGMALVGPDMAYSISSMAQQVFDVTGAGDTVIATLALALAAGNTVLDACVLANYAAGIVVEKVGAAQASVRELQQSLNLYEPQVKEVSITWPK